MNEQKSLINFLKFEKLYRTFIYAISISILFSFMVSCGTENTYLPVESFEAHTYQPVPTDMQEISAIEGNANIKFPPSAHEIYAYTTGFRDISIQVRFSMQSSELPEFLNNTLCNQPLATSSPQEQYQSDLDWWVLSQAQHLEECFGKTEHSRQHLFVDMTNEEVYVVYVSTSTY